MVDATAYRRMTLDAFLAWDGEPDMRYQLLGGVPVAMAQTEVTHQAMVSHVIGQLAAALHGRPYHRTYGMAGIRSALRGDSFYVADIAVSCAPVRRGEKMVEAPVLIVEVLSPSTEETDRKVKLADYRSMPSVQEVLLIDPNRLYAEVHRRFEGGLWVTDLLRHGGDVLRLQSVGLAVPLSELYAGLPALEEAAAEG